MLIIPSNCCVPFIPIQFSEANLAELYGICFSKNLNGYLELIILSRTLVTCYVILVLIF